jgi:hypothetical protein
MIRLLLRLYPRAWRERYGDELRDLVAAEGLRPSDAWDIARAAVVARVRSAATRMLRGETMTIGPAWRHPTAWAIAGFAVLLPTALFVAGSLAAYQLGLVALQGPMDRIGALADEWRALGVLLVGAPVLALALAALPLLRLERGSVTHEAAAIIAVRVRRLNIAIIAAAVLIGAALAWYFVGEVLLATGA